jgi:hypothetical protein
MHTQRRSFMKKRTLAVVIAAVLAMVFLLAACAAPRQDTDQPTPEPTATPEPQVDESEGTKDQNGSSEGSPDENGSDQAEADLAELAGLFPEKEGYKWVYNGYAEYGHEMKLKEISRTNDRIVYTMPGEVYDMSDGESDFDYSLDVTYTVSPGLVIQEKTGEMVMDEFDYVELIRGPLVKGNSWTQTVKRKDGSEVTLESTITDVVQEEGVNVITVEYRDKNSEFYEKRIIKEGIGVVGYEKLILTEAGGYEIAYFLYEEASGYKD